MFSYGTKIRPALEALASDMSLVVGHKVSLPKDLKSYGQISPPPSICSGPVTKEAQPIDEAEALCSHKYIGQILSYLSNNNPKLLVRELPPRQGTILAVESSIKGVQFLFVEVGQTIGSSVCTPPCRPPREPTGTSTNKLELC
jgi:hypothetical protein